MAVAIPRGKACRDCARAKRRCDLGLPCCGRCLERRAPCVYPWSELAGSARATAPEQPGASSSLALPNSTTTAVAVSGIHSLLPASTDLFSPAVPPLLEPAMSALLGDIVYANPAITGLPMAELLPGPGPTIGHLIEQNQTQAELLAARVLARRASAAQGHNMFQERTEYAARRLALQAGGLASAGHNIFVHHTQIGASAMLRDVLAASALYEVCNTANAAIIMCEIRRRATLLVRTMTTVLESPLLLGTRIDPLPPLQALLFYQCMLRFGKLGDSAMASALREQAAQDQAVLMGWLMLILHELEPVFPEGRSAQQQQSQNGSQNGSIHEQWHSWIRRESVRRTIVCTELVMGIDAFLTHGWDCADVRMEGLGFTAQVALWEAQTAEAWEDVAYGTSSRGGGGGNTQATTVVSSSPSSSPPARCRPRLETGLFTFGCDQLDATPDDVDDLAIVIRATNYGLEALADWLGRDWAQMKKWGL